MKVGIAQLTSSDSIAANFNKIKNIVIGSQTEKPAIIFFPENSLFFRVGSAAVVQAVGLEDQIVQDLAALAKDFGVALHLTTAVREQGKVFNASIMIDVSGDTSIAYKKMHLFDIELTGQKAIRESDTFLHGATPSVTTFSGFKIGHSICYDLRFSELYSRYAKAGVDLIVVPSAFLVKTGLAHWEVLLRARAIESQCYVIASAQAGVHRSTFDNQTRETFGHSMVVDPWGNIVAKIESGEGIFYAELSHDEIAKVRKQIPMNSHRRDVF